MTHTSFFVHTFRLIGIKINHDIIIGLQSKRITLELLIRYYLLCVAWLIIMVALLPRLLFVNGLSGKHTVILVYVNNNSFKRTSKFNSLNRSSSVTYFVKHFFYGFFLNYNVALIGIEKHKRFYYFKNNVYNYKSNSDFFI